jgi:putative oxidoreductase
MFKAWSEYSALPLRLVVGLVFVALGAQKLFGLFGGQGLAATAESMTSIGFSPGMFWAVVAGVVELAGGLALLIGFLTRWAALVLALATLVGFVAVQLFATAPASQTWVGYQLVVLAALVSLLLSGAQHYALDERLPWRWTGSDTAHPAGAAA